MSNGTDGLMAGLGGTISQRIAGHLQRAILQAKREFGPQQARVAQVIMQDFTNHVSDEIRNIMGPLWNAIADSPDVAPWLRDLTRNLGTQRGQAMAWIAGTSTSLAMGSGLSLLLTNELQPAIGAILRVHPNMPLSAADSAGAAVRGLWREDLARGDFGQWGLNSARWEVIKGLNQGVLSADAIVELFGKGWITRQEYDRFFRRAGWDGHHAGQLAPLARTYISPRDGGSMWNRSIIDMRELEDIVVRNGHIRSDAQKYADVTGEPLPVQDLMTAQRRGIIDQARARRGWVQGPVRNEWFDVAQEMQYSPMSTVDAADAVNQNHMPLAEGRTIAEWNGLIAEHFDTLIKTAGLPPGVELASEALNRGLLTLAEFRQAFLESRLKNKYVDLYVQLRHRVIPQETVRRLYRLGAYTRAKAKERLGWAGFAPEDAEALLAAEDGDQSESARELTKSEIIALYTDGAIAVAQARAMLTDLGYPAAGVNWELALADLARARRYLSAVISRVHAGYVAGRITKTNAETTLDRTQIPPAQRDDLIDLWDLEREALTRGLTPAQVKSAWKKDKLTRAQAVARLENDGYSREDANILLDI